MVYDLERSGTDAKSTTILPCRRTDDLERSGCDTEEADPVDRKTGQ